MSSCLSQISFRHITCWINPHWLIYYIVHCPSLLPQNPHFSRFLVPQWKIGNSLEPDLGSPCTQYVEQPYRNPTFKGVFIFLLLTLTEGRNLKIIKSNIFNLRMRRVGEGSWFKLTQLIRSRVRIRTLVSGLLI